MMTDTLNEWFDSEANRFPNTEFSSIGVDDGQDSAEVPAQEVYEAKRSKRTGAQAASPEHHSVRDGLVLEHISLVKVIVARMSDSLPRHIDVDDLTHAGIVGLIDAASKFDADKQVSFASFAKHRIRGAIIDSLRKIDAASRDLRRRQREINTATHELIGELGRMPTESETADRLGIEVDRLRETTLDIRNASVVSADSNATDHDDCPVPEFAGTDKTQPDTIVGRGQMNEVLARAMSGLLPRHRQVIAMYYMNEMTMSEIATALGVNESRISQIHKAALTKMNAALQSAGIHSTAAF